MRDWISILEKMNLVALVQHFSTNLSSRLSKSPKIFFLDTGLACRLQGWSTPEPILTSPQQGALFENLVFVEIQRTLVNFQLDLTVYHWRSRDGEEVDLIFIESKVSPRPKPNLNHYPQVKKIFKGHPPKYFQCHQEGENVLDFHVPLYALRDVLLQEMRTNRATPNSMSGIIPGPKIT